MGLRINVRKELIPYGFSIALGKEKFNMRFAYNRQADLFTVSLYRGGKLLCHAEPIIYGVPLFRDVYEGGVFPVPDIVPSGGAGDEAEVTWDNFGSTVFLTVGNGGIA